MYMYINIIINKEYFYYRFGYFYVVYFIKEVYCRVLFGGGFRSNIFD